LARLARILKLGRHLGQAWHEFRQLNQHHTFRAKLHAALEPTGHSGQLHRYIDNTIVFWVLISIASSVLESVASIEQVLRREMAIIDTIAFSMMRAPSSMNTQPWNFYVVTGEPLNRIRAGNTERTLAGVPQSREFRTGQAFAGQHRDRQVGVAKQLFSAMGIARDDADMRQDWVLRGFRQFDAPVCIIVTYDRVLDGSDDTPFDCGAVATSLVNAAWSRGLGAVINSQGIMQSPVVREHAGIADDQVIMKSIALGWPDDTFPANAVVSERKSVEEATVFVGFDDPARD